MHGMMGWGMWWGTGKGKGRGKGKGKENGAMESGLYGMEGGGMASLGSNFGVDVADSLGPLSAG